MQITQYHEQQHLLLNELEIDSLVMEIISFKKIICDEIIIHFVTNDAISELHQEFFNDPSPTDCITFPIDGQHSLEHYKILGEIFISPEMATDYSPEDPYLEVTLYIVHSILHLLGYDDIDHLDIKKMRDAESELMNHLKKRAIALSGPNVVAK